MKRLVPLLLVLTVAGTLTMLVPPQEASASYGVNRSQLQNRFYRPQGLGRVVRYSYGVMERVRDYRARKGQLTPRWDVAGWAAVPDCGMLGRLVYLTKNGRTYRFQVVDCVQYRDWNAYTLGGSRPWAEINGAAARWFMGGAGHTTAYIHF